jgi:hypothetical protein
MQVFEGDSGRHGLAAPSHEKGNVNGGNKMGGYESTIMEWLTKSHLNAFTPPDDAACSSKTPLRTKLISWVRERAYLKKPMLLFVTATVVCK